MQHITLSTDQPIEGLAHRIVALRVVACLRPGDKLCQIPRRHPVDTRRQMRKSRFLLFLFGRKMRIQNQMGVQRKGTSQGAYDLWNIVPSKQT